MPVALVLQAYRTSTALYLSSQVLTQQATYGMRGFQRKVLSLPNKELL